VTYSELAAATAQRRITVEQGLQWLISRRKITLVQEKGDQLLIAAGNPTIGLEDAQRLWEELQALLAETSAYRAHFKRADKESLLP
jgi:hypothetical protein